MGITREQTPTLQPLQVRVRHDTFQHPFTEGASAIIFVDEYVAQVGKDSTVCHHPGKANLPASIVHAKVERMLNGFLDHLTWTRIRPIGTREKVTNYIKVQVGRIV